MAEMKPIEMIFLCEPKAYKASDGGEVCFQVKAVGKLVRCGECKHMEADGTCKVFADDSIFPSASDYCSYGERKDGGGDK